MFFREIIFATGCSAPGFPIDEASPEDDNSGLFVLSSCGKVIYKNDIAYENAFGNYKSGNFCVTLCDVFDLDDDEYGEIVWKAEHCWWYPSAIGIEDLFGGENNAFKLRYWSSGPFHSIIIKKDSSSEKHKIIFCGFSNGLLENYFVGAIRPNLIKAKSSDLKCKFILAPPSILFLFILEKPSFFSVIIKNLFRVSNTNSSNFATNLSPKTFLPMFAALTLKPGIR